MTTTAAASFAPSFAPQTSTVGVTDPDLAPAVVAAVREWRREDKLKTAIDAATKAAAALEAGNLGLKGSVSGLEKRERDARTTVGKLVGGTTVLVVDGEQLAVECGEKGGGNPDHASAWDIVRNAMTPDWQAFMDETLAGCVTKASPTVKITVIPVAAPTLLRAPAPSPAFPDLPAAPAAPGRRRVATH
jgi:hypothetical protein